ncbi:response regulator [Rhodovulum marinum]|uniref:Response regulator receiver domain-containing protein n=1 Tax=Rhodovulum marinum TaxID=320662 RepID=A0A4R2Q3L6_9RHOB|nr:response regulator [Rhodovulum marinum]TCP43157.1 response regulator receiver domain-containing protein [Rhodovulum marinum]
MPRIAVIDDEPEFLDLLPPLLAGSGVQVDCARTPEAFFALLAQARYDAVLVDFWLGGETSLGVLDRIAAEAGDLPVILVSGGGGGHSAEMAEALGHVSGVAVFLHKPFRREELLRALDACAQP